MKKDSIGNRMKENYEQRYKIKLTRRTPVIIRLDGKAFHTLTRKFAKPFDVHFQKAMQNTSLSLCKLIQGAKCIYTQSDEISVLVTDFDKITTDAWFDYNLQKIVSVSSGTASVYFNYYLNKNTFSVFDGRAFNVPKEEVCNYFVWRQQDWLRNSIQMLSQFHFSHKQLHKKNTKDMHEMLHDININWNDLAPVCKNGNFIYKKNGAWHIDNNIVFTKNKNIFDNYLEPEED